MQVALKPLDIACKKLTKPGSLKLYLYMCKNQNGYIYELSSKDFMEWANVSKPTYINAFNELVEKGFLKAKTEGSNMFEFYDVPQETDEKTVIENKNKEFSW